MKIAENTVVTLNYTLLNSDGMLLDTSDGREPLVYLHGVGALIPGLESELTGKVAGDKLIVVVAPEHGYGDRSPDNVKIVPKSGFNAEGDEQLEIGMQVQLNTQEGQVIALVTDIQGEDVTLDTNHPLAGMTLHFDIDILDIRKATQDEIDHGHVHGPGGHHH